MTALPLPPLVEPVRFEWAPVEGGRAVWEWSIELEAIELWDSRLVVVPLPDAVLVVSD